MAYVFPLESILKHRKRQEELAQKDFIEARHILEECLAGIEAMYRGIDEARVTIQASQSEGTREAMHLIHATEMFIDAQKIRIHQERQAARELIRILEEKEEVLLERLHERKIMDKLKEKRFEEYRQHLAQLEQKELDDMNNSRRFGGAYEKDRI